MHEFCQSKHWSVLCLDSLAQIKTNTFIGRAVRHQRDWASLILLDRRYASTNIRNKLPKWIGDGLIVTNTFGQAVKELGGFYRHKRSPGQDDAV